MLCTVIRRSLDGIVGPLGEQVKGRREQRPPILYTTHAAHQQANHNPVIVHKYMQCAVMRCPIERCAVDTREDEYNCDEQG
jgi:hypothetical protein